MKNSISPRGINLPALPVLFLLFLSNFQQASAQNYLQNDEDSHTISYNGSYQDYLIPECVTYSKLKLTLNGGDGGRRLYSPWCNAKGGEGATVVATFNIGTGSNQLKPGSTLRFIVGEEGVSKNGGGVDAGGGGGGTAILYKEVGDDDWVLLAVAGGGGGAFLNGVCDDSDGRGGTDNNSGSAGKGDNHGNGGSGGNGGEKGNGSWILDLWAGGGGGVNSDGGHHLDCNDDPGYDPDYGGGRLGGTEGGEGGESFCEGGGYQGGFGFGGGGYAHGGGGGGGGYSGGGGGGYQGGGGGGGSYVNSMAASNTITAGGTTSSPANGYCYYEFQTYKAVPPIEATCVSDYTVNVTCPNGTTDLDGQNLIASASGGCGSYYYSTHEFDCSLAGQTIEIPVFVGDFGGNLAVCYTDIYVNAYPVAICKNITVSLNSSGSYTLTPAQLNNGSYDPDGGSVTPVFLSGSNVIFNCNQIGVHTVMLIVKDDEDSANFCFSTVTVQDNTGPTLTCKNATVNLNASGSGSITTSSVYNTGSDNCGTANLQSVSPSSFTCSNIGANVVTLTANDGKGNTGTCTATVTVADVTSPTITCKNATVSLNAGGLGSITTSSVYNTGSDNCGTVNLQSVSPSSFNCSNIGANIVTLIANDGKGNIGTCTATVTVSDVIAPTVTCKSKNVNLNASGLGSITTADVFNTGSDNCGIVNQVSVSPNTFGCNNIGANTVTLTVNDGNGNTATCTATVTVADVTAPTVTCKNATANLNAGGSVSISTSDVYQSGSDNCGTVNQVSVSPNTFGCNNLGANTVTLTVNDGNGNTATCTATVTVADPNSACNAAPIAVCQNVSVHAGATCTATVAASSVDNGSYDPEGDPLGYSISPVGPFSLGATTVTLTVTDNGGHSGSCTATVTVSDVTAPSVTCKNASMNLNASGSGSITTASVFQSGADNCGTVNQVSVVPSTFNCGNLGANTVTLTVNDGNGNTATCTATVTVSDVTAPSVTCKDGSVNLDASGSGSITTASVFQSGSDNCGTVNQVSVAPNTFDCSALGANTVTLTVNDDNGNTATCTATVTVEDVTGPSLSCQLFIIKYLDANGIYVIQADEILQQGTYDNCGTVNVLSISPNTFDCSGYGGIVTLTADDGHGNTANCETFVLIFDDIAPTLTCRDAAVTLDENGNATLNSSDIIESSSDNCSIALEILSQSNFDCSHIGENSVSATVYDGWGQTATCTVTVTVVDPTTPTVTCKNMTVNLDDSGLGSITTGDVFQSGADNCGMVNQVSVFPNTFDCSTLGANVVTLTVNDANGNTATCTAIVTVADVTGPSLSCQLFIIKYLDENGIYVIQADEILQQGTYDNCGTVNVLSISPNTFGCSDYGGMITLTADDGHGNTANCETFALVTDNIAPTLTCSDATIMLDGDDEATLNSSDIIESSSDNCSIALEILSQSNFDCSHVGENSVSATVYDGWGQTATCTVTVTVVDPTAPTVTCKNMTVNLDDSGSGSITTGDVFQSGADNCGTVNQVSVVPSTFNCGNLGANTVTLTVNDGNGNTATCTATVTVSDVTAPSVTCKDGSVNLDASGSGSITTASVFQSGSDNCGTVNQVSVAPNTFNCGNLGANTVTLTVNDGNGNTATCTATVTVSDVTAPSVTCKDASVNLNAAGSGSITTGDVFQSGADNCGTVNQVSVAPNSFSCGNLGANAVTLTVNDGNGNTATCTATVTVADVTAPTVICKDASVNLNASGSGSITTASVFQSGADNCGTVNQVSVVPGTFSCGNLGANAVTLTVNDGNGNTATCTATVTVADVTAPTVTCKNASVNLNAAGSGSITTGDVFQSGADNCGTVNQVSVVPGTFSCGNLGANAVTLTVNDGNGNTATCTATVTVSDVTAPSVTCKDASVNLNASGSGSITTGDVFQSGADNCGTVNQVSVVPSTFNCGNLGANTVTLTVNDGNGNTATCTATVTVSDVTAPSVTCKNASVNLNAAGTGSITTGDVFQSGADNCGTLNQVSVVPSTFNCGNLGANTVTLTVNDGNGNTATCTATVTVSDVTAPSVTCKDASVNLNASGSDSITTASVFQSGADNCGTVNQVSVVPGTFSCGNLGANTVTLTVNDGNGNTATCTATVTVADVTAPTVTCKNASVNLNAAGTGSIIAADLYNSGSDNCGTVNLQSVSPGSFGCNHLGANTVTLTVNDGNGNTATCTATVTVRDLIVPTMICKSATISLNASGQATLTVAQVNDGSYDNCGITNYGLSQSVFTCSNLGENTVSLFGRDAANNRGQCMAIVTVNDPIVPVAKCKNATLNLGSNGTVTVAASAIDNGSSDNCTFTLTVTPATLSCANLGANTVTLRATDAAGNSAACTATVTVKDASAPVAKCQNPTIYLDTEGKATLTVAQVNNGSSDNCGVANMSLNYTQFDCSNIGGLQQVMLTLTDQSNNSSSCTAQVSVKDNTAPTAICENTSVSLNANGFATVYGADLAAESFDNCSVWSYSPAAKVYTTPGTYNLAITVKDWSNNGATCTSVVSVLPHNPINGDDGERNINPESEVMEHEISSLSLYPNPTSSETVLRFGLSMEQSFSIQVFDLRGSLALNRKGVGQAGENVVNLSLDGLPSGVYIVDVQTEGARFQNRLVLHRN